MRWEFQWEVGGASEEVDIFQNVTPDFRLCQAHFSRCLSDGASFGGSAGSVGAAFSSAPLYWTCLLNAEDFPRSGGPASVAAAENRHLLPGGACAAGEATRGLDTSGEEGAPQWMTSAGEPTGGPFTKGRRGRPCQRDSRPSYPSLFTFSLAQVPDPMMRYKQLLYFASKLKPMPADQRVAENRVPGCTSQAS